MQVPVYVQAGASCFFEELVEGPQDRVLRSHKGRTMAFGTHVGFLPGLRGWAGLGLFPSVAKALKAEEIKRCEGTAGARSSTKIFLVSTQMYTSNG